MKVKKDLQVICFGAINLDLIFEIDEELALRLDIQTGYEYFKDEKELDSILYILQHEGTLRHKGGGGSAANTAVALSRLGTKTGFIGKVGEDKEGDFLLESLEDVDKKGIGRGGRSGMALCLLIKGERSIIIFSNTNDTIGIDDIDRYYAESCDIIHLTSFAGDSSFNAQKYLLSKIRPEIKVSFDPGILYAKRGIDALLPILRRTDIFFPEKKEIEILTKKTWKDGALEILKIGPKVIVCTMGEEGSHIVTADNDFHIDAPKAPVVDTTGAGDVYAAGFIASYLNRKSLKESAIDATTLASRSITGFGRGKYPEYKVKG
ncbi:MAG: carbohydrate kinase family protein [Nitrospirae bacterium]|nr:carbohydrate kinase family protein [Nitrospirota bacterium]